MALKEMAAKDPEQLTFKAFELAEVVRELNSVEVQKKDANEEWGAQIKALKKRMFKLAQECREAAK